MTNKTPTTTAYAARLYRRAPGAIALALPVPVFHWRICSTTFGFRSAADRDRAARLMRARYGDRVSVTPYRDVQAPIAAQIIVWPAGR